MLLLEYMYTNRHIQSWFCEAGAWWLWHWWCCRRPADTALEGVGRLVPCPRSLPLLRPAEYSRVPGLGTLSLMHVTFMRLAKRPGLASGYRRIRYMLGSTYTMSRGSQRQAAGTRESAHVIYSRWNVYRTFNGVNGVNISLVGSLERMNEREWMI